MKIEVPDFYDMCQTGVVLTWLRDIDQMQLHNQLADNKKILFASWCHILIVFMSMTGMVLAWGWGYILFVW